MIKFSFYYGLYFHYILSVAEFTYVELFSFSLPLLSVCQTDTTYHFKFKEK